MWQKILPLMLNIFKDISIRILYQLHAGKWFWFLLYIVYHNCLTMVRTHLYEKNVLTYWPTVHIHILIIFKGCFNFLHINIRFMSVYEPLMLRGSHKHVYIWLFSQRHGFSDDALGYVIAHSHFKVDGVFFFFAAEELKKEKKKKSCFCLVWYSSMCILRHLPPPLQPPLNKLH